MWNAFRKNFRNISCGETTLENEIITLQTDLNLQARKCKDFLNYINRKKYPSITKCSEYIYFCFGPPYLCELAFSYLNLMKTNQRPVLTDTDTQDLLLSLPGYTYHYDSLVRDVKSPTLINVICNF